MSPASASSVAVASAWRRAAPAGSESAAIPSRRETRRRRQIASSAASEPASRVAVGGKDLSQSRYASALATGRTACSSDITLAPARVVDIFQPVSSAMRTPARSSSARTRRTRTRSSATSATGRSPRPRWSSTCAAAAQASSSKPSQSACAGGSASNSCAIAAKGWSRGTSVSTTSAGASPWPSNASASGSTPPAWMAIHADGRRSNKRSVDAASGAFAAHSTAIRASCFSRPAGPPTPTSSASRAACHHAARADGARADAARASSCAVVATRAAACSKPRRSRRIHSAPQRSRASNCVATSVSSAASKLLSPSADGLLVRATRRGCASSRRAASRCRDARRRAGPARAARRTARAPRHRATRPRPAAPNRRRRRRCLASAFRPTPIASRDLRVARAAGPHAGYRLHREQMGAGGAGARPVCQNDCACRRALLTSAFLAPPPSHRHEDPT